MRRTGRSASAAAIASASAAYISIVIAFFFSGRLRLNALNRAFARDGDVVRGHRLHVRLGACARTSIAGATVAYLLTSPALAWDEQRVLGMLLASSPVLRAYKDVTQEYIPRPVFESTSIFARVSPADIGTTQAMADSNFQSSAGLQLSRACAASCRHRRISAFLPARPEAARAPRPAVRRASPRAPSPWNIPGCRWR
jgi:hypothetical protein